MAKNKNCKRIDSAALMAELLSANISEEARDLLICLIIDYLQYHAEKLTKMQAQSN